MERINPITSHLAHKSMTSDIISGHHKKIIEALKFFKLGANYEQIANHIGLESHAVGRRLCELEREQIVYKPGSKQLTKSGRAAYIYKLVTDGQVSEKPEKIIKGKGVSDYANAIISGAKVVQKGLFDV